MDTRNKVITTLRTFEVSDNQMALRTYLLTILGFVTLIIASGLLFSVNPWLSLLFWFPSAILLCRLFVMQHDAGHLSLFTKNKYNRAAGLVLGFITMIPSRLWNHIHDAHHGILGNLDMRKINPELWTLTVNEYVNASFKKKFLYRFMRSIFARLILTPAIWIIVPRIPLPHLGLKIFLSVLAHNIIYGVLLYFIIVNDWTLIFTFIYLIPLYFFNLIAAIFFYLNHQYENTSWEKGEHWDLFTASINGSAHLVSSPFWSWVSGNVGCHHIHHLNTKIPSSKLANATEEANKHLDITPIYLHQLFHHLRCALWDEEANKLIPIRFLSKNRKN